jgi:hypothetical protein
VTRSRVISNGQHEVTFRKRLLRLRGPTIDLYGRRPEILNNPHSIRQTIRSGTPGRHDVGGSFRFNPHGVSRFVTAAIDLFTRGKIM